MIINIINDILQLQNIINKLSVYVKLLKKKKTVNTN